MYLGLVKVEFVARFHAAFNARSGEREVFHLSSGFSYGELGGLKVEWKVCFRRRVENGASLSAMTESV